MCRLEELCIYFIVENFERFYCAFTASNDEYLQRNFQFLQRRFSVVLATGLYVEDKLKEEHFGFLINEHLNFLVGKWFKNSPCLKSMGCIFHRLPNLTRICFPNCGDELVENVAKFCPKIVEMDVRNSKVTDNGVKFLYEIKNGMVSCPELKNLFIRYSLVTDKGAKCLIQNLPSLEKFDYLNVPLLLYSIHKESSSFIKKAKLEKVYSYNLIALQLSDPKLKNKIKVCYSDVLKACLAVCPKLESISYCVSEKRELNLLTKSRLKKLHLEFYFSDPKINIDNFLKISGCSLTFLKLSNPSYKSDTTCRISVSVLTECCPALKELHFHNIKFTNDNDGCLSLCFPSLTKCCFSQIDSSEVKTVCLILASSPKLESISFRFMLIPEDLKKIILMWCKNPASKLIEFVFLYLEKEFIKDILLNCSYIRAMFLFLCKFDDLDMTNSLLHNFVKEQSVKLRIFAKNFDPFLNEVIYMHFINHKFIFNHAIYNLENYLKEEYRCSNIYDYLFPEIASIDSFDYWDMIVS